MLSIREVNQMMEKREISKEALSEALNIPPSGLEKIFRKGDSKASIIERLADYFNIPLDYLFDREIECLEVEHNIHIGHKVNVSDNARMGDITISECRKDIEHLQQILKEKEIHIDIMKSQLYDKERMIQILMK